MTLAAHRFIEEAIEVIFDQPPLLEKKPCCPNAFVWRGETYRVTELLAEWHDYARRGRMSKNMRPSHAAAAGRGSWGVGVFHFQVRTDDGRFYEIYYDRAPQDADHRKGNWFLYREMVEAKDAT